MRQKANLCKFENQFAAAADLEWKIEPKSDFVGGRVVITARPYDAVLHQRLSSDNERDGNRAYEMLFLVPPDLVAKSGDESVGFKLAEEWGHWGFSLWDGTVRDIRTEYPRDIKQHRVLQYDSCRGLEGWVTVCLWMDELVRYKQREFDRTPPSTEDLYEATSYQFACRWAMMPMTRAVDTLVITMKDPESEFATSLRKLWEKNQDFVEWIE